jgi:GntR family transcriptional regulator
MILLDLNSADEWLICGQVADSVKFAVVGGILHPGDLVPSVRELSKQLVVNPNAAARAYRDLQAEGLLKLIQGMGLQIAEGIINHYRLVRHEVVWHRLR